ncbi:uncharacterized protein LOC127736073 [Mytilus californianus]|uniref:uncharacterized protein LOC127736073 n=1 Tax=Mytilus californianus TaxID=6549 RepID=UPI002246C5FE|nr:uncharacterized protein LOC127736073 [Mytilus californianus]
METISRHELVPFTALMNMIKFNYLEKKEVYQGILGILGDYDPSDEENKKRTTRYIELLLADQTDLAEYLLSFLPNGMAVDHIGVSEIKDDTHHKLKLKKKKIVKLYQASNTSTMTTSINNFAGCSTQQPSFTEQQVLPSSKTLVPVTYSRTSSSPCSTLLPIPQILNDTVGDVADGLMNTFRSGTQVTSNKKLPGFISKQTTEQNLYNMREKVVSSSNIKMTTSTNILTSSSVYSGTSSLPILYESHVNQAPICPVVPSLKLQKIVTQGTSKDVHCNVNPLYTARQQQCQWVPEISEPVTVQAGGKTKSQQSLQDYNPYVGNDVLENNQHSVIGNDNSIVRFDLDHFNTIPENVHYLNQHEPLIPSLRFPLHSTPKFNFTPTNVSMTRKPVSHDFLSLINQPVTEHHYQPISEPIQGHMNMYHNTRALSAFPYTHEFVFPNGKTQNVYVNHVNRSGVQIDQNLPQNIVTTQNNIVMKSLNRNQSHQHGRNLSVLTGVPMQNITNIPPQNILCDHNNVTSHTVNHSHISASTFNTQSFLHTQGIPTSIQQNTHFLTPTQTMQAGPSGNLTPHMLTPVQYNQELSLVDPVLLNQSLDTTGSLNRTKPKKLSMTANSAVRKKLRLTPNNSNIPM